MHLDRRSLLLGGLAVTATLVAGPAGAQRATARIAGAQSFDVGGSTVTALADGFIDFDPKLFPALDEAGLKSLLDAAFLDGKTALRGSINAFVATIGDRRVLIDSGAGGAMGASAGHLPAAMEAAGIAPASIGAIVLTHLHPDHFGGLLDASGKPVFAEGPVHVHEAEIAFWRDDAIMGQAPEAVKPFFQMARAVLDAYGSRVQPITKDGEVLAGLTATHLPGHTPGHTGFTLASGDKSLFVWGDVIHAPALQFPRPAVSIAFDVDQDKARETRMKVLDRVAADRADVAGMHLAFPALGNVEKAGEGYRFAPRRWDYDLSDGE